MIELKSIVFHFHDLCLVVDDRKTSSNEMSLELLYKVPDGDFYVCTIHYQSDGILYRWY
jgi:hypothetical protein